MDLEAHRTFHARSSAETLLGRYDCFPSAIKEGRSGRGTDVEIFQESATVYLQVRPKRKGP